MTPLRHTRQSRLAGVGAEGQRRIGRAVVGVPFDGLAGEVAVRYLAGAGVGVLRVRDARLAEVARAVDPEVKVEVDAAVAATVPVAGRVATHWTWRHGAALELARGATWALEALRAAVEGTPS